MEMKQVVNGLSEIMAEHWNTLKEALYSGETEGLSLEEIIEKYTFFKVFDDVVNSMASQFEISVKDLGKIYRGVGVNEKIELDFYQRMIPHLDHVRNHNRMNPPGKAFIYLGVIPVRKGRSEEAEKKFILRTIEAELRVEKGDFYTSARFESNSDNNIFNLVGDSSLPMDIYDFARILKKKSTEERSRITALFYFNLFNNDQIFKPVHSTEHDVRAREYAPFQLLAKYFMSKGYAGIKYRSTVHREGTNVVIFNPKNVKLVESSMEKIVR
ncbi:MULTISPECIES: RES family NAD+ phosphorylase [unclassified Exiguobacterium]|uniref:RES family NAD+ phosphorylase n=1 Tax=unclassified Exiguobacterium TaxID=2644629 RepID=UPI001BE5FEFA|nr:MULTISPECIES: RES family NAD+ phosphorylase [unclassified Exiguobacterium]